MKTHDANPFPNDPDRREIWDILMRKDFEAFVAADWSVTAPDFIVDEFLGIDGHSSDDPDRWTLRFPRLDAYRSEWLRQAVEFQSVTLVGTTKLDFLYAAAQINHIEIHDGRAVAHKKFDGRATTGSGTELILNWQTLYFLRNVDGHWKITGFVGYLPNNRPAKASG